MATENPFHKTGSSRYMLALQVRGVEVEGGNLFTMFFDTFAEAKAAAARNLGFWNLPDPTIYKAPLNGFSLAKLPAEFVKAQSRRYGRCEIARRGFCGGSQELVLIALR
jgi:hypothetical protein